MALRFAIIKHIRTQLGQEWEDIVYEYQEEKVFESLLKNFLNVLPKKKWYQTLAEAEVRHYFELAWKETVSDFKKVTLRIV